MVTRFAGAARAPLPRVCTDMETLEMEPIFQLDINFPRVVEVRPSESGAVVEQQVAVSHVECGDGERDFFPDFLTHSEVEGGVSGQV